MRTYTLHVEDDRYSVPTLRFVSASEDSEIRRIAGEWLTNEHNRSVEVRDGDMVLFQITQSGSVGT